MTTQSAPPEIENQTELVEKETDLTGLEAQGWEKTADGWGLLIVLEIIKDAWAGIWFDIVDLGNGFISVIMEEFKKDERGDYCVEQSFPPFRLVFSQLDSMVRPYLDRACDFKFQS